MSPRLARALRVSLHEISVRVGASYAHVRMRHDEEKSGVNESPDENFISIKVVVYEHVLLLLDTQLNTRPEREARPSGH